MARVRRSTKAPARLPAVPAGSKPERQRIALTSLQKMEICKMREKKKEMKLDDFGKLFTKWPGMLGKPLKKSTLCDILKDKERWLAIDPNDASKFKQRSAQFPILEARIAEWVVREKQQQNVDHISDRIILLAAQQIANDLSQTYGHPEDYSGLKFSNGWLANVKARHSLGKPKEVEPVPTKKPNQRCAFTSIQKMQICQKREQHPDMKLDDFGKLFKDWPGAYGMPIPKSTMSAILKAKDKWLAIDPHDSSAAKQKQRSSAFPILEAHIASWVATAKAQDVHVTDIMLLDVAKQYANGLMLNADHPENYSELKFSNGWISNLKERNGLVQKRPPKSRPL